MSGLFGGVLGDPHARVKLALTRDLESRRSSPTTAARFSSYLYKGCADLLLQHGRFYPGRELPAAYERVRGPFMHCFGNALAAAINNPELRYCEGVYTSGFGSSRVHAWCLDANDEVVEVTMPTTLQELNGYDHVLNPKLDWLPPEHWGYYGVVFHPDLVEDHGTKLGLPLFDRSPSELSEQAADGKLASMDFSEPHDFPILKVPYDPNRKALP